MFGKKSDQKRNENNVNRDDKTGGDDMGSAPPLKPFSRKGSHAPSKPPTATSFQLDAKRPKPKIPGPQSLAPNQSPGRLGGESDPSRLIVGRDIQLSGEITACEKLVVEGTVEITIPNARVIEIAPSGHFTGSAKVDEAYISGRYDGELVANEKLIVREGGHIKGTVRYGSIVIESGGEISGDMQALEKENTKE